MATEPGAAGQEHRVEEALKAHARGWLLTPLDGKKPITKKWQKAPAPSKDEVERWARAGNVGLRTGQVSGVVVIDDDTPDGAGVRGLSLPETVTVRTGSGKHHYYFKSPSGGLGNSAGKLAERVDVRGDGGQVVFVGSIHPEAEEPYTWAEGLSPDDVELAEFPAAILESLSSLTPNGSPLGAPPPPRASRRPPAPPPPGSSPPPPPPGPPKPPLKRVVKYAKGALRNACGRIRGVSEGERNNTLNKESFSIGKFVGCGALDHQEAVDGLRSAALEVGLGEDEAMATLQSGLYAGYGAAHRMADLEARTKPKPRRAAKESSPPPPSSSRPDDGRFQLFYVDGGDHTPLHRIAPLAVKALAARCADTLYVRGNRLVRVSRESSQAGKYVRRGGGLRISLVPDGALPELLDSAVQWIAVRQSEDGPKENETWAPRQVVLAIRDRGEWPGLRILRGVVESPTLRPDGTILGQQGYDEATGLLYEPSREYKPIPDRPTDAQVAVAVKLLLDPFREFRFEGEADKASLLALLLTIAGRSAIDGPAPHWAVMAPTFGAGKTLLCEAAGVAMTGVEPDLMSPVGGRRSDAEGEMRKRLTTMLLEAPRAIVIDNLPDGETFESKAFAALLTTTVWTDRILGKNEKVSLPHMTVWMTTGCNYRLWGDLARRSLSIVIDPGVEDPHRRTFEIEDLLEYVRAQHPKLLAAALTILRGFVTAGRPRHSRTPLGKFEAWDRLIRGAAVWATALAGSEVDPLDTAARLHEEAPDRGGLAELLTAWNGAFPGGEPATAREAIGRAHEDLRLREAIVGIGGARKGEPDARALGNRLRVVAGRVAEGLTFRQAEKRQGAALWRVVPAGRGESRESRESVGSSPARTSEACAHVRDARARFEVGTHGLTRLTRLTSPTNSMSPTATGALGPELTGEMPVEVSETPPEGMEPEGGQDPYAAEERAAIQAESKEEAL